MPHHKPMVPSDFTPPERVVTNRFIVRPLLFSPAKADYEAWSTSLDHLRGVFGPSSSWPSAEMTLEENAIDLAWHQREHESATSFAFAVFDTSDARCVGCIYFVPARKVGHEVEAFYWVRASEVASGLDEALGEFVEQWVTSDWPFESVVYPGRSMDWPGIHRAPRPSALVEGRSEQA